MCDPDQISRVEQRHLQPAASGEFLNLAGAQGRDPLNAIRGWQVLANAGAGDHATVANEHNVRQTEAFAQLFDLSGDRLGIAAVARKDLHRHRTTRSIGEQAENDLWLAGFVVARLAQLGQRTLAALEVRRGHIV
jgi:hypothetical protein